MTHDLATALRRALSKTRASDPAGATALIQAALSGVPASGTECGPCAAVERAKAKARSGSRTILSGLSGLSGSAQMPKMTGLSGLTQRGTRRGRAAPVPEGAQVEMRRHDGSAGGRDYRLFVPSPREGGFAGLVLMLHGCTQSPEDFALGTKMDQAAEEAGFVVAYPAQTGASNAQSCWNWFRPEDQGRARGEPAILGALAQDLAAEFSLEGRVFAAGLSAGGAMAAVLAETHGDVFAAVGIHSGLPAGAARDLPSALAAMQGQVGGGRPAARPAIVFHGTADRTVSPANAAALVPGDGVVTEHEREGRRWTRMTTAGGSELWIVEGAGHAWFGGDAGGSHADPAGPDASGEMLRFFAEQTAT
ncbi:PHB depolymerase family esterase [Tropicimonas sp. IMCC34011]|uniref:extracellular catalytic domain type 1 short-chain-length polyhydroxyalkanoate depolymerase n=1 Tax=Tropicimonas sp. IMCC34011 TaxID=2248759 RepID=UPI000E21CE79|nr:PHB depolymerase family esterase [Tropicimonas sp. IMCC34011]